MSTAGAVLHVQDKAVPATVSYHACYTHVHVPLKARHLSDSAFLHARYTFLETLVNTHVHKKSGKKCAIVYCTSIYIHVPHAAC